MDRRTQPSLISRHGTSRVGFNRLVLVFVASREPAAYRDLERVQNRFSSQVIGHGPADDPAAERVEHDRQVHHPAAWKQRHWKQRQAGSGSPRHRRLNAEAPGASTPAPVRISPRHSSVLARRCRYTSQSRTKITDQWYQRLVSSARIKIRASLDNAPKQAVFQRRLCI